MTEKQEKKGAIKPDRAFELKFGYEDKETPEVKHRSVVFGRRSTGADFIRAMENSNSSDTQFGVEMMVSAITKFGEMQMPVPMTVLLSLNRVDREKLSSEFFLFLAESSNKKAEKLTDAEGKETGRIRFAHGIERDGKHIVEFEFGNLLSGYDDIEIERQTGIEEERNAIRIGKEIAQLFTSDGTCIIGGLTFDEMKSLDIDDFTFLREVEPEWLDSFRQ